MTIKDALDRAKLLRQARLDEQRLDLEAQVVQRPTGFQNDSRASVADAREAAPVLFEPLKRVEISEAACAQNRILMSDNQLRELPQAAAAYRLIRSKVQQRVKRGNWFSFAVSSPRQNDGKTVTALNLAFSIAREKQRPVYVLDLDMRNPSVCGYLGLSVMQQLSDYFAGDAKAEDILYQTSIPYLIVAGASSPVNGPSEMLAGPRLEALLQHIRQRSPDGIVIIDLPPVNVTDEALLVAPRVDAVLIVVSEGKTQREELARTLTVLNEFSVAGVIVNRSSEAHAEYYDRYSV